MKKEWMKPLFWSTVFTLMVTASCGINDFGVLSIDFDLNPTEVTETPEGLDPAVLATLDMAHGTVHVDVHEGAGTVTAEGLPDLPQSFEYEVILLTSHHERDGLEPGHHDDDGGNDHGDDHGDDDGGDHGDDEFESVHLGHMHHMGDSRMIDFDESHMDHHSMGTIRAARVVIEPPEGEHVEVMFGEVEIVEGDSDEGGHEHGG